MRSNSRQAKRPAVNQMGERLISYEYVSLDSLPAAESKHYGRSGDSQLSEYITCPPGLGLATRSACRRTNRHTPASNPNSQTWWIACRSRAEHPPRITALRLESEPPRRRPSKTAEKTAEQTAELSAELKDAWVRDSPSQFWRKSKVPRRPSPMIFR